MERDVLQVFASTYVAESDIDVEDKLMLIDYIKEQDEFGILYLLSTGEPLAEDEYLDEKAQAILTEQYEQTLAPILEISPKEAAKKAYAGTKKAAQKGVAAGAAAGKKVVAAGKAAGTKAAAAGKKAGAVGAAAGKKVVATGKAAGTKAAAAGKAGVEAGKKAAAATGAAAKKAGTATAAAGKKAAAATGAAAKKAGAVGTAAGKRAGKEVALTAKAMTPSQIKAAYAAKGIKGLGRAGVGAGAVAAATAAGYAAYKRFFSAAAKACAGKSGAARDACVDRFKKAAKMAQVKELQKGMASCGGDQKCRNKFAVKIAKAKAKM